MPNNKVITRKNGVDTVLLDVSQTTATEEKVLKGEVFTKADGTQATGTLEQSEGYQMSLSADGTVLSFVHSNAPTTISFTINGTSYEADDRMTWAEWIESDYNTSTTYVDSNGYVYLRAGAMIENSNGSGQTGTDIILSNEAYTASAGGGVD